MFEKQLRQVKSTVYLTGKQSDKTRRRMVDLLAPARREVVATTANTSTFSSRPSSYRSDSTAVVDALESAHVLGRPELPTGQASMDEYLGLLKEDPESSSAFAPESGPDNDSEDFLDYSKTESRLDNDQRICKMDLMEADLSVVDSNLRKGSSTPETHNPTDIYLGASRSFNKSTWLVLYSGANAKVEQAVIAASNRLNVSWRKEYFNKW
ncbi:putative respiratory burst oxidase homolog protein [Ectocarpus siliculosus]|uniref:Respiratory burst oxidase homolog protein n=1 Tax=Ectocarpus siliculosus TaxID=2880 RepID=D7G8C9_ECTSI|nr:putative respiratory burst oxidase homolog protein [Ectocarpus siliculosus]|eukprot:CBJ27981.1 putative respiratory burst oxidase homolog protein [Ectocarpus siliculosus]